MSKTSILKTKAKHFIKSLHYQKISGHLFTLPLQMSWNTMMEGFKRHEKTTGQNPLKMAEKQNEMIKTQVENLVKEKAKEELEAKVAELRRLNEEKEAELEKQKREIMERERYYRENAPPQVRAQMAATFGRVVPTQEEKMEESRFEELDD